ncbi:unnamed protein product, partial [Closterium sp. NIES-64]
MPKVGVDGGDVTSVEEEEAGELPALKQAMGNQVAQHRMAAGQVEDKKRAKRCKAQQPETTTTCRRSSRVDMAALTKDHLTKLCQPPLTNPRNATWAKRCHNLKSNLFSGALPPALGNLATWRS